MNEILDPLKPVMGQDGRMITAVVNQVTLPKAPAQPTIPAPVIPAPPPGFALDQPVEQPAIPPPPTGFVLDQPMEKPVIPPPPPGFTMDQPVQQPTIPVPDTFLGDVKLAGKVIGTGLYSAAMDIFPKTLAETWKNGNLSINDAGDWVAKQISDQKKDLERWELTPQERENRLFGIIKAQDVLSGLQNLGYSGATAVGGAIGGAAIATAIPVVGEAGGLGQIAGGMIGAGALTAPVAYRASKTQFVSDMRDKLLANNPNMTEEEWQQKKKVFESDAQLYAMWEAGPEVVGNMLTAGIIKTPAGKLIKEIPLIKNAIARTLAKAGVKLGMDIPVEVGTETVTQFGQETVQQRQGLQEEKPTLAGSFSKVLAPVLVTTIATLGLGAAITSKPAALKLHESTTPNDYRTRIESLGIPKEQIGDFPDRFANAKTPEEFDAITKEFAGQFKDVVKQPEMPVEAPVAPEVSTVAQPQAEAAKPIVPPANEPILSPPAPSTPIQVGTPTPAPAGVSETPLSKTESAAGTPSLTPPPTPTPNKEGLMTPQTPEVGAGALSLGAETKIHGTRGQEYDAKYAVVPRSELVTSHDGVSFTKNPDYPLENARDYTNPAEQTKVLAVRTGFTPDRHVTDSTDASVGPVMVAGVTDEKGRKLVVLGGNNREMAIKTMAPEKRQALADFTNKRAERFGVKGNLDADHELVRFMGEYDLRQPGTREKLQGVIDALNPSPGKVQNQTEMAAVDAGNIPLDRLEGVNMDMDPKKAAAKVMDLIADKTLDANLRSQISEHPDQAQEYLRRVMVNVAFHDRNVADFVSGSDTKTTAARGLIEAATPGVVELRKKGQNELADAFGRTMATLADYVRKGDDLRVALQKTAQQKEMDPKMAIIMDVADVMRRNVAVSAKSQRIIAEDSIANFKETFDRINEGLKNWNDQPDMFGTKTTADDVIRNILKKIKAEQQFENNEIRVSKREPKSEGPFKTIKAKQGQYLVDEMMKNWANKPMGGVVVVQNEADLDLLNLNDESRQAILNSKAEGFYHMPTESVVIIADNLQRPSDVIRVMLHESIGHFGIQKVLGPEFEKELERIGKLIPAEDLQKAKDTYGEKLAIEEYLAKDAATRNPTLWQQFIKAVREALKRIGVNDHILDKWDTRGEIEKLIDTAKDWVERGEAKPMTPKTFKASNATITAPGTDQGIRMMVSAYHGTPHTFAPEEGAPLGKFKKEKVGTGEGAAAYGWGVAYVAENKGVAVDYQNQLSGRSRLQAYETFQREAGLSKEIATDIRQQAFGYSMTEATRPIVVRYTKEFALEKYGQDVADKITEETLYGKGNLYHVEIDADPADFLDWDKPLSEQSEQVKKALEQSGDTHPENISFSKETGNSLYDYIRILHKENTQAASEYLASLGIKGIRYADQGSRQRYAVVKSGDKWQVIDMQVSGDTPPALVSEHASKAEAQAAADKQQTFNYVVFNESDIRVVGRNGEVLKPSEAMTGETRLSKPEEDTRQFKLETVTPDQLRSEATLKKQNEEAKRRVEELQKRMADPIKGGAVDATQDMFGGGDLFNQKRDVRLSSPDTDVHKFSDRVAEDDRMMLAVRKALEFQEYNVLHNKDVIAAAQKRIKASVPDAYTAFLNPPSDMKGVERAAIGMILMRTHNEAAKLSIKENNETSTKAHLDRVIDIGHKLDEIVLEAGQTSQIFATWNDTLSTLEGAQRMFERNKDKFVDMVLNKSGKDVESAKTIFQDENTKAIDETLMEDYAQKRIADVMNKMGMRSRNGMPERMKKKSYMQGVQDFLSRPENSEVDANDVRFAGKEMNLDDKIDKAARYGVRVLAANKDIAYTPFADAMKTKFGVRIEPYLQRIYDQSSIMLDQAGNRGGAVKGTETRNIRSVNAELKSILKQWFAGDPNTDREPVLDLLKSAGMTEREALELTMGIQHKFIERAQKSKTRMLEQMISGRSVSLNNQKAIKRLLELSNLGPLNDPVVREAIARAYKLPALTPEIAAKLDELAKIIKNAPEGFQQHDATREMLNYMRKQMPTDGWDVGWSMWYANILSGYQTAERNFLGNAWNLIDNLGASMVAEPRNAPFALWGMIRGINAGVQGAANVLKTGNFPVRGNKYEASSALELKPFTGIFKVFNSWKYVMRSLYAADMLFFKPAQEARAMMIAADLARKEGVSGKDLWRRAAEIMGKTGAQREAFKQQAMDEGLKGLEVKKRQQELAEQQRPDELIAEPMDYAQRVTFNYQPEGQLGRIAKGISDISRDVPILKLAVPFTRIVANVANTTIDHTLWGFVRAWHGMKDGSGDLQPITGHRRAQLLAKATMGTAAMVTAYLLDKSQDDDDDKKKFAIYGAGPGSTTKRYQMEETGWKPYSIKLGKHYFDYRLTPFAVPFAIVGNIRDAERWRKMDEKSLLTRTAYAALKSAGTIFDMSFLSGMNQIVDMTQKDSPDSAAAALKSYLTRNASTVVPALFKQIDRTFDANIHDNSTIQEGLLREVPIASHSVKPKLNLLGQPVKQTASPLSIFFSKERSDPVWKLIVDKEAWISNPDKDTKIRNDIMNEDEYYNYVKESGEIIREKIQQRLPQLQAMNKERAGNIIDDITQNARERIKNKITRERLKKNESKTIAR
jgi:hypothetical protein